MNITGTNDVATISGTATGAVTEDNAITTANGVLSVADVDTAQNALQAVAAGTAGANGYGTFSVLADGHWTYTLDNASAAVQALGGGVTATDTITVASVDGTASQVITVTITGTNDAATISGTATGAVTEDNAITTAIGALSVADADAAQSALQAVAAGTAGANGYGAFSVLADGHWTYTLDNTKAAVQALGAGVTATDSITVASVDGTANQLITVTITGTNDVATISGTATGAVTEDNAITTASGVLSVVDVDSGQNALQPVAAGTAGANGYGSFAVLADGHWTYTLDNTKPAVQALSAGVTTTDTITVASVDGTQRVLTVTITGTNDAPVVSRHLHRGGGRGRHAHSQRGPVDQRCGLQ